MIRCRRKSKLRSKAGHDKPNCLMDLLLDTHAFVWWDGDNTKLSRSAFAAITEPTNRVFISVATIWEIAIKKRTGRLYFPASPLEAAARNGFLMLAITGQHAEAAAELPLIHKDPFDRLLVAQAQLSELTLVTTDAAIRLYDVAIMSAK